MPYATDRTPRSPVCVRGGEGARTSSPARCVSSAACDSERNKKGRDVRCSRSRCTPRSSSGSPRPIIIPRPRACGQKDELGNNGNDDTRVLTVAWPGPGPTLMLQSWPRVARASGPSACFSVWIARIIFWRTLSLRAGKGKGRGGGVGKMSVLAGIGDGERHWDETYVARSVLQ